MESNSFNNSQTMIPSKEEEQPYASYSMTDQDIDDQIATINSLTISDQHPMDTILDTSASNNATKSFRGIFPDNTAFTPQSTDRHLFRNNSFSIQQEYTPSNNLFMSIYVYIHTHTLHTQFIYVHINQK
ncbi:hypothetical protein EDC94DRAFT_597506 [Helicostylum pulchrum]|nr:hypothetical protein EDC94DRAFT_597506 [Helicostylum pulchrum]